MCTPLPDSPNGEHLADALQREARRRGVSLTRLVAPLWGKDRQYRVETLRGVRRPNQETIARIRALIAGQPLPARPPRKAHPNQNVRRVDREEAGLPPSKREIAESEKIARDAGQREREEVAKLAAHRARSSRLPGETLAEAVKREAVAAGRRRSIARVAGGGTGDHDEYGRKVEDGEDDPDVGELTAARRAAEMRDVASPSALIRRVKDEWPEKCSAVAAISIQLGVQQGEAWLRVVDAGIRALGEEA